METNLTPSVLGKCRETVQKYGPYFGKQLYTVVAHSIDMNWKKDVQNDENVLRKEVIILVPKAIDIVNVNFIAKDLDGCPKIVLNRDVDGVEEMVFPIANPDFCKATRANLTECIERIGNKNSAPMFFAAEEFSALAKLLKTQNQGVLTFYEEQSRKMAKLAEAARGIMDATDRMQTNYLRECGVSGTELEARMHVEITEE